MAHPASEVRRFWRVAQERFEDAKFLLERARRPRAATYLAGYSVECGLKALLLATVPQNRHRELVRNWTGRGGHDYAMLRQQYVSISGRALPRQIVRELTRVSGWDTRMRYLPGVGRHSDARAFLNATAAIMAWVKGRL